MRTRQSDDGPPSAGNPLDDADLFSDDGEALSAGALLEIADQEPPAGLPETGAGALADLPLDGGAAPLTVPEEDIAGEVQVETGRSGAAPLLSRLAAFAADSAFVLLLTAAPLLAATAGPARSLAPRGLWWTAMFAIYLSFFATIIPLVLFGKTVGMALTGLTARSGPDRPALTAVESARRWIGSLLAAAGLGIPLLFFRDVDAPSLADRLSGRPLEFEEVDSR